MTDTASAHLQPGPDDLYHDQEGSLFARVPQCPQCKTVDIRNLLAQEHQSIFGLIGRSSCCCRHPVYKCQLCNYQFEFSQGPSMQSFGMGCPAKNCIKVKERYIRSLDCYKSTQH